MELFYQPNEQPSNDEIVNIRKQAWDLVWTGMNGTLDASALDASFTGATTHHTVTAHRTVTRR